MTMFLTGLASGLGIGIAFILYALWHSRRYPMVKDEPEILAAETTVYMPRGWRIVK